MIAIKLDENRFVPFTVVEKDSDSDLYWGYFFIKPDLHKSTKLIQEKIFFSALAKDAIWLRAELGSKVGDLVEIQEPTFKAIIKDIPEEGPLVLDKKKVS